MAVRKERRDEPRLDALSYGPHAGMKDGDTVLIGYVASEPSDWHIAKLLWWNAEEALVETSGLSGNHYQRSLVELERIRVFGSTRFCIDQQSIAREAALGTARQIRDLEEMVSEVRAGVAKLIEAISAAAIAASKRNAAATPPQAQDEERRTRDATGHAGGGEVGS